MEVMTASSEPLTVADLAFAPSYPGAKVELPAGSLVISEHQFLADALYRLLADACPDGLRAVTAPLDVALEHTLAQPDVLVARLADFAPKRLEAPPLLAVEVLSPSTRLLDLGSKKLLFEGAGVPSYWVLDPAGPRLLVFELVDGAYVQVADVTGEESWTAASPYPLTVTPARLLV